MELHWKVYNDTYNKHNRKLRKHTKIDQAGRACVQVVGLYLNKDKDIGIVYK